MLADFLECTTTSIGGIAGAGAVTLARYNGLPLPNDIWGAAVIDVDYVISDQTTAPTVPKLERGVGTITSGVLTRTLPRLTWNGTAYDEYNPAPLAFGVAPAAGNVRVRIAPTSDQFVQAPPSINTANFTSWGMVGWMPTANLIGPPGLIAGGAGFSVIANREYYFPYLSAVRGNITGMGIWVADDLAGVHYKMAIYGVGSDGLPGPCISKSGIITCTTPGIAADQNSPAWTLRAGPLMLRCGWFYIGVVFDAPCELGAASRASLAGPTPLGQLDQFGWGSAILRNSSNTYVTGLPSGAPTGPYSNAGNFPNSVPSIVLSFEN